MPATMPQIIGRRRVIHMSRMYRNGSTLPPMAATSWAPATGGHSVKNALASNAGAGLSPPSRVSSNTSSAATRALIPSSGSFSSVTDAPPTANWGAAEYAWIANRYDWP